MGFGLGQLAHRVGLGEEWESVGKGTAKGAAAGAAIGSVIPGVGTVIGGAAGGLLGGLFGGGGGTKIGATPEQSAAFERETALRGEAIRQARGMGGAAARDAAQQGALAYGAAGGAPAGGGRLAGLRDIGQGAEGARQQAALEASIFEREASPEAARQKKMAWLTQQMESLRAAGRLTPGAIQSLMPMAGGDPQIIEMLNQAAVSAPGETGGLGGFVTGVGDWLTSGWD